MEKITVKKEEKQVLINFNTNFYPTIYIFRAAQEFSNSCWTSVDGNPENLQVMLRPKSEEIDLDTLGYEFYNYVLSIIKNEGKIQELARRFR